MGYGTSDVRPTWTVSRALKITTPYLKGDDVKELQQRIYDHGIKAVVVDGKSKAFIPDGTFGPITEAAVRLYQMAQGLLVDGKAGQNTVEALGGT